MAIDLADIVAGNGGFVIYGAGTHRATGFSVSSSRRRQRRRSFDDIVGTTTGGKEPISVVARKRSRRRRPGRPCRVEAGDGSLGTVLRAWRIGIAGSAPRFLGQGARTATALLTFSLA